MSDDLAGWPEILTTRQMRAVEDAAIGSGRVSGDALMERAGAAVVEAILNRWPEYREHPARARHRAIVLCGPGNNGGDGFVVARLLAERGWQVRVSLLGDPDHLPPDARRNYDRWREIGSVSPAPVDREPVWQAEILVDALFGIGLSRRLDSALCDLFDSICEALHNVFGGPRSPSLDRIVAVDVPSGLCADSGRMLADDDLPIPRSDLTVTFHRPKLGHLMEEGPEFCGALVVADIGLDAWQDRAGPCVRLAGPLPGLLKRAGHKYDHGHALVLGGGPGHGGAARLSARAALRVGAGLVTLACPPEALAENAARLDAVMLAPLADAAGLRALLRDTRLGALALGPGLGLERARALVPEALASGRAAVLDADALTAFADRPEALFAALHPRALLTPHGGEFARLFPDLAARLAAPAEAGPAFSRLDAARLAAARAGCAVLLKGPDTVVAAPDGSACIAAALGPDAAPWLATAGAGDVLTGIVAGLLARGFAPLPAAGTGAWLHAEAARDFGPGLIAEDLPERLPAVLRRLAG
ncbi:bifunctional ADP-dependent NAD(P)H-hydrate dehydratase/NAD(P)H-hydrate epimerase [Paracoccus sp. N5]|uniref:bifunctional ADP-dependent NAD(P)H-hydrate dehydratase/NAD(P)H-hydrate epimerase n=1 Tax=Paracoccus sp. N5 TaxID=1101189 RepID=UPI00036DCABD|nr:bifunctional ADP-dependent NAD(P)H-hydrate dehydratase/NAD(P)H-hydrate epimerase [Paracoccus sp. N5]